MNYSSFKVLLKQLMRSKLYTAITIFGFSVALMFVILLGAYVKQELLVDSFHVNKDRVFRMVNEDGSFFAPPIGERIKERCPEVESYTRLYQNGGYIADARQQKHMINYLLVDSSFFTIFSFELVEGNPREVLRAKNSIVLNESYANKLFYGQSAVGKEVVINERLRFMVTGIMKELPTNTHFQQCDALVNFEMLGELWNDPEVMTSLGNNSFGLYVMAKPNVDITSIVPKLLKEFKKDYWLYSGGYVKELNVQPVTECYFSELEAMGVKGNSKKFVVILLSVTLLILIIAIINYVNLSIAQSSLRSREIAVKKLMGSTRLRVGFQLVLESILICLFAFNVALILATLVEPYFNNLLNTTLNLSLQVTIYNTLYLFLGIVMIGAVAGTIPAVVISRVPTLDVLKGAFRQRSKGFWSRILISLQFVIATVLIICAWIVQQQTSYMKGYRLGFAKENIIQITCDIEPSKKNLFLSELRRIPNVVGVSFVKGSPTDGGNNFSYEYKGKPVSIQAFMVDSAFFPMLGIKTVPTGMAYSQDAVWLNRAAVRKLGLDSLPKAFPFGNKELPVVGITEDFHFKDLHEKVGPAYIGQLLDGMQPWSVLVKIAGENQLQTVKAIDAVHSSVTGGLPMDYSFMDETINKWYAHEERTAKLIGAFSLLAVIISLMGILAMTTFYLNQRVKELGIRKIVGAGEFELLHMLNRDLLKWVLVAFVVACPIAYYASMRWLENFPYRIAISWWIFAVTGVVVLLFALITVSWQSWIAANRNPVESLKCE